MAIIRCGGSRAKLLRQAWVVRRSDGRALRVTVSGGCPRTDRNRVGVVNQGGALTTALLPAGHPTAARICRYAGANGKPFTLRESTALAGAAAAQLAAKVAAISLAHDSSNPVRFCPMADWAAAVIAFSFPGRSDIDLWVRTNGCTTVSNGWIMADGDPLA